MLSLNVIQYHFICSREEEISSSQFCVQNTSVSRGCKSRSPAIKRLLKWHLKANLCKIIWEELQLLVIWLSRWNKSSWVNEIKMNNYGKYKKTKQEFREHPFLCYPVFSLCVARNSFLAQGIMFVCFNLTFTVANMNQLQTSWQCTQEIWTQTNEKVCNYLESNCKLSPTMLFYFAQYRQVTAAANVKVKTWNK